MLRNKRKVRKPPENLLAVWMPKVDQDLEEE